MERKEADDHLVLSIVCKLRGEKLPRTEAIHLFLGVANGGNRSPHQEIRPDGQGRLHRLCTSKKLEYRLEKTRGAIDSVMTFEELQAFVDARSIDTNPMVGMEMLGR